MEKEWVILPKVPKEIIDNHPEYSRVVLQLLYNRGLLSKTNEKNKRSDIDNFLFSELENLLDPFLFKDLNSAVEKIIEHIKRGDLIYIYGDYDVDGVTASAILFEVLELFKAKVKIYIPDRKKEGYGLNNNAIEKIAKDGAKLIITVDNGIRNKEEVDYAKNLNIDFIITDHHEAPADSQLPDCLIINPKVGGEIYPEKNLAGAGVAYKLANALIKKSNLDKEKKKILNERLLDLAAIGTIADCVSLLGENRIIVKEGLRLLQDKKRLGISKLIKISGIENKKLDSWNIAFQIAPRLNAAGRLNTALDSFNLLISKNEFEALSLANGLNGINVERQNITEEIIFKVEKKIKSGTKIIIAHSGEEEWDEGVVGLVAGKICEKYYKPALIITKNKEHYKGSGRSIKEFNLIGGLEKLKNLLIKYGGHKRACGFSLKRENMEAFIEEMEKIAESALKDKELKPSIIIDLELSLREISGELLEEVEKMAPFGQDNEKPKFISKNLKVLDKFVMGALNQHVKLKIGGEETRIFSAVGFNMAKDLENIKIGDQINIAYHLDLNEFNNIKEIQLKIISLKKV